MSRELCDVRIRWDISKVDMEKLFKLERLMRELGVSFDTGAGCGYRDWEWDCSLKGPVNVEFCCLKKDREKTSYERNMDNPFRRVVAEKYWMNDRDNNLYEIKLYQLVSKEDGSCNAWRFEEWVNDELKKMANYPNNRDGAYNHFYTRRNELDSSPNVKTRGYPNIKAVAYVNKVIEDIRGTNNDPTK